MEGERGFMMLFAPGTKVAIGSEESPIDAIVSNVLLLGSPVTARYLVVWWEGRIRYEEWLEGHEVSREEETKTVRVGFV